MFSRIPSALFVAAIGALLSVAPGCITDPDEPLTDLESELASTSSFQNGVAPTAAYAGTSDTTLQQSLPAATDGASVSVRMDHDYPTGTGQSLVGLLRFDLAGIPAGSTVSAVTLTVNVTNPTSGAGYLLFPVARAWSASSATWTSASSGIAWAAGGGRGATDRSSTAVATLAPTAVGKTTVTLNAAGVAAVQAWVNTPASNFGLAIDAVDDQDGLVIDSSEASVAANRPRLVVTYTPPAGAGTGLRGDYYAGTSFQTLELSRIDRTVDFDWGTGAPATELAADGFSVRWSGQVLPAFTETYTFFTTSDDGVRLTVNGQQLIDNWTIHDATENSRAIALTAGQKYDIKLEYFEGTGGAVSKLAWSSARQAKQIIPSSQLFPAAAPPPPAGGGLDHTGATIPDTNYAIPAGTIFLATTGSDGNAGTQAAPVRTLARATTLVPSGGTIVVRGGLYRDGGLRQSKPFTIQPYPHEQVWFDGTDVQPTANWTSDGNGHWSMAWSTPSFCDGKYYNLPYNAQASNNSGPCTHFDMYGDPAYPAAGDPQMVFIDGAYIHEVTSLAAATGANFFYDWTNKRIYIATNPSGHTIELASRPSAMILTGAGTKVRGLGFKRYATNEHPSTLTSVAVYSSGTSVTFENDVFKQMAGGALHAAPRDARIATSVFVANGYNGLGSNGSQGSGGTDSLVIDGNVFNGNNAEHYGKNCSASCGQAGVKLGHMVGFTAKNNVFENNVDAHGFWCDLACSKGVMVNNVARNNGRSGIMYEVSDTGIIASNLVYGNGNFGIRTCSANTKIYNNTVVGNGNANIWNYDDPRSYGVNGWTDVGPDTRNVEIVNNIISGTSIAVRSEGKLTTPNTVPAQFYSAVDYNAYYRASGVGQVLHHWVPPTNPVSYTSLSTFTAAKGFESHSTDVASGTDPFFVDGANGNYTVRTTSTAYHTGRALPADVAGALGLTTTTIVSRGAIRWPGNP
jgi:hypothetical protein